MADLTVHIELAANLGRSEEALRVTTTDALNEHLRSLTQAGMIAGWRYEQGAPRG